MSWGAEWRNGRSSATQQRAQARAALRAAGPLSLRKADAPRSDGRSPVHVAPTSPTSAIRAFGGRGARHPHGGQRLFAPFCLVLILYGLNEGSSTTGERVGGVLILLVAMGMAVAPTVPMFARPAKAYFAGRARAR
jgi:hypothetical protein